MGSWVTRGVEVAGGFPVILEIFMPSEGAIAFGILIGSSETGAVEVGTGCDVDVGVDGLFWIGMPSVGAIAFFKDVGLGVNCLSVRTVLANRSIVGVGSLIAINQYFLSQQLSTTTHGYVSPRV